MYKVFYGQDNGKQNENEDVKEVLLKTEKELINFFECIEQNHNEDIVYLFTEGYSENESAETIDFGEILITINMNTILEYIKKYDVRDSCIHIHEYKSFESAYAVALSMREGGNLCYDI